MTDVVIGQDNKAIQYLEGRLETDGSRLLIAYLAVQLPWTRLPVISFFVDLIVKEAVHYSLTWADRAAYAAFVSVKTGVQVSAYVKAKQTGDKAAIDKAAENLIRLGGM